MTRPSTVLLLVLGAALIVSSGAWAQNVATSETTDGNRTLLQRFSVFGRALDYNVVADDPDGLYPLCVTVQLQKRTKRGWRAVDKDGTSYRHECLETPEEGESSTTTHVGWDTFIYPTRRLYERFRRGDLRLHGSTDLGGELTYRR